MRILNILKVIVFIISMITLSCDDNFLDITSGTETRLEFTNSATSDGRINAIVWANGDARWDHAVGYDPGADTGAKTVTVLNGTVVCAVDPGGGYITAIVSVEDSGSDSLSLRKGEYNKYTLVATAP